jgi:hypothetical protein
MSKTTLFTLLNLGLWAWWLSAIKKKLIEEELRIAKVIQKS